MRRTVSPYLVALGMLWGMPLGVVGLLHLTLPDHNVDGTCEGIGYGCVLAPADIVVVLGFMAAPVLGIAGLLAIAGIASVQLDPTLTPKSQPQRLTRSQRASSHVAHR